MDVKFTRVEIAEETEPDKPKLDQASDVTTVFVPSQVTPLTPQHAPFVKVVDSPPKEVQMSIVVKHWSVTFARE
jgi:hypothetical protein